MQTQDTDRASVSILIVHGKHQKDAHEYEQESNQNRLYKRKGRLSKLLHVVVSW